MRKLGTSVGVHHACSSSRLKQSDFKPQILSSRFKRDSEGRFNTPQALFLSSYSLLQLVQVFNSLGLRYSRKQPDKLKKQYLDDFNAWSKRGLHSDVIGILIDAYISKETNHICNPQVRFRWL